MRNSGGRGHVVLSWTAAVAAGLVAVLAQQAGQILRGRNPIEGLRTNFWYDQLGYLGIAANVANGDVGTTEPISMTGVSHYPRLYYSIVGGIARVFGLPTVSAWNLTSFVLQVAAVTAIGIVAASLSRRWWVALLAPLPFLTGTFAYLYSNDSWYTVLQAHAVLWGPYGALFSNNAETAGLCVGLIAVSLIVWTWSRPRRPVTRWVNSIGAAAMVGVLSSFQTYSFLTFTYLLVYGAAICAIVHVAERRRIVIGSSLLLLVAVFLLGPVAAERIGQLPTLMLGLSPALPGLVVAIIRTRGLVAAAGVAAVATAAPQILFTLGGIASGDPFLSYRVASNHQLGIVSWQALVSAAAVIIPLVAVVVLAIRIRDRGTLALAATALVVFFLLALNDVWGANAEPYRFWIEGLLVGGVIALLGLARMAGISRSQADSTAAETVRAPRGAALLAVVLVSAVAWAVSLPDWVNYVRDGSAQATWDPSTAREEAIADVARSAESRPGSGLIVSERCVDNRTAKVTSGAAFAYYHLGMAWPADKDAVDDIIAARDAGTLDFDAMESSNTVFVITDSNCSTEWSSVYADRLEPVASERYALAPGEVILDGAQQDGEITLWRVTE